MKIKAIRSYVRKMALTKPYSIAGYTFSDVDLGFVEIELANGIIGLGTASPAEEVVGETTHMSIQNLQSDFVQSLIGESIENFQGLIQAVRLQYPHMPGTHAAMDIALHDAYGKWKNQSVVSIYGRKIESLPTSVTIGIMSVEDSIKEAKEYEQLGFRLLKVKTGENVEEDIEKVRKLHEQFGRKMRIRVDPNQGYSLEQLAHFLKKAGKIVELIEQPLAVGKEQELIGLGNYPIMADESITDTEAAQVFTKDPKPFQIYNIKLMKSGGIQGALEIALIAKKSNIDLFWGCNDESRLSITAALHAAYSMSNTKYLDLDGSFDLAEDLVSGGFELKNGLMNIKELPGFGVNKI